MRTRNPILDPRDGSRYCGTATMNTTLQPSSRLNVPRASERIHSLVTCALALLFTACGGAGGSGAKTAEGEQHPLVGAPAPDFTLKAQYGAKRVSLEEAKGKVTIVDFWATWCEPCRESFPAYQKLLEKHESDLAIIGVSVDDAPDEIPAFASATGVKFPLAWDDGQAVAGAYKPPTMPTSYVIDQNQVIRHVHVGFKSGDDKELEKAVVSLLK
jgi:cytochrome c biogenesis protein CcmG, thiol:disulfide interchange protein DsbE